MDRLTSPALAAFFRSLASPLFPSPSPSHSAPPRTSTTLEFFDNDLYRGPGARLLLEALRKNPRTDRLSASQNSLEDVGVRVFCEGLRDGRETKGECLRELNFSGNGLTDLSLPPLITHLLSHNPTLTHLYLNNNSIALSNPEIITSLTSTVSSPESSLRALSLTSNTDIDARSIERFLEGLELGKGSRFEQLHLSVCSLGPDAVPHLVKFLESSTPTHPPSLSQSTTTTTTAVVDERGGSERLQVLALNANSLYNIGVRRIAKTVSSGTNVGLLSLELLANQPGENIEMKEGWKEILEEMREEEEREGGVDEGWKEGLREGLERNRRLLGETREAALSILGRGRILFGGNPTEGEQEGAFAFLRLPIELQVNVYRCSLLLTPSTEAHHYTHSSSRPSPPSFPSSRILSSPLTETQFLHLLSHVGSSSTLAEEIRLARPEEVESDPLNLGGMRGMALSVNERGEESWAEWVLWRIGCDRFMKG